MERMASTPESTDRSATPGPAPAARGGLPEADASLYLHPQTLARLGSMDLRAKMIVEGVMSGQHRSPYKGFSVEFAQHRPYVKGDDLRHLDWKVFGRSDKLYLKQYEQETNLDLVLLVDCSGSMNYGSRSYEDASGVGRKASSDGRSNWTKYDHATATAAAFAYMALKQGDRVGLGLFADALVDALDRTNAMTQWRRIVGVLSQHPVARPTDFGHVIDQTLGKLATRCLIVIVSDFFEDPARVRTALARIRHKRHDVVLVQVIDERERSFDFDDALPLEGMEGEGIVKMDPRSVRAAYLKVFNDHCEQVRRMARGFGFDFLQVCTHDWLGPAIAGFVAKRNALLKRSKVG